MSCSDWDTLAKWVKVGELSPKLKMYENKTDKFLHNKIDYMMKSQMNQINYHIRQKQLE